MGVVVTHPDEEQILRRWRSAIESGEFPSQPLLSDMETLFAHHSTGIFERCYAHSGDAREAERMAEEVLAQAWRELARFREESTLETWLGGFTGRWCAHDGGDEPSGGGDVLDAHAAKASSEDDIATVVFAGPEVVEALSSLKQACSDLSRSIEIVFDTDPPTEEWSRTGAEPDASATVSRRLEPGTKIEHYELLRLIDKGGMGEVYLARDTSLGRKVALKLLHERILESREAVDRFMFEARATARFSHPNIVTVFGVGEYEDRPYVALEYIPGQTLRRRMREGEIELDEAVGVGLAVAHALQEAGRHGILHRDLKPENILLAGDGRVRVLDFGLAKRVHVENLVQTGGDEEPSLLSPLDLSAALDAEGKLRGTPAYMAPEQWTEAELTPAADVWALGLILREMLAEYPWPKGNLIQLCHHICSAEPVPELPSGVPGALSDLVSGCLAKSPKDRTAIGDLISQLETIHQRLSSRPALSVGQREDLEAIARGDLGAEGATFGKYRVIRKIGEGAFGAVYEAVLPGAMGFSKRVAIKMLRSAVAEPRFIQSMVNEARIGGMLHHDNIVDVLEFDSVGEIYYLSMEFVDGLDLGQIIQAFSLRGEAIPPVAVLELADDICRGLQYAHSYKDGMGRPLDLIHRDLKPGNIIVNAAGTAKILDFGIAKAASNLFNNTATGMSKGTPRYMSPEQLTDPGSLTHRSDIFSIGAVLYEMVTGGALFAANNFPTLAMMITEPRLDSQLERAERAIPGMGAILERALRKRPEDRYPTAGDLARDLRQLRRKSPTEPDMALFMRGLLADDLPVASAPNRDAIGHDEETRVCGSSNTQGSPSAPSGQHRSGFSAATLVAAGVLALAIVASLGFGLTRLGREPDVAEAAMATAPVEVAVDVGEPEPATDTTPFEPTESAEATTPAPEEAKPVEESLPPAVIVQKDVSTIGPEPEEPATAAEPDGLPGAISIRSRPWSRIYVDGNLAKEGTALIQHPVDGGAHEVRLVCPDRDGLEKVFSAEIDGQEVSLGCWDFDTDSACR